MLDIHPVFRAVTTALALALAGPALAQTQPSEGEIRKIDKDTRKLTIRHGPIRNLDMPGMTMVFSVKDDDVLDRVHVGEKVRFEADKIDGKLTVIAIESAQ